jgi:LPXTG-motif cell wall-anchored protein
MKIDRRMNVWGVLVFIAATPFVSSFSSIASASTDASTLTWTKTLAAEANIWKDIAFGNGVYVAVSSNGNTRVMRTTDPTCTPVAPATSCWIGVDVGTDVNWQSVTFGEGLFVAVGEGNNDSLAMTSLDGITWTRRVTNPNHQRLWSSVEYANGNFVAVAFRNNNSANTDVMTSPDGITWTLRTTPEFTDCTPLSTARCNQFWGLAYGNGAWVAVGWVNSNGASFNVMRSTDNGATWTYVTVPSAQSWRDVTFSGSEFIAVSRDSGPKMMTSTDGITWTERSAPPADGVQAVGSTVVLVNGNSLDITYSYTSNLSCTPVSPATHCFTTPTVNALVSHNWLSIKYLNERFFLVGTAGTERVAYTSIFTAPQPPPASPTPQPESTPNNTPTDTPSTTLAVPSTAGTIERDGVTKADRLPATGQQMNGIIALALSCTLMGTASLALRRTKN